MTRELRNRIWVTVLLLAAARLLWYIPVPGVDLHTVYRLFPSGSESIGSSPLQGRGFVGGLGVMPYVAASTLVTLWFLLRRKSQDSDEPPGGFHRRALVLGLAMAAMQGFAYAVYLANLGPSFGSHVVPNPGVMFLWSTTLTMTVGFALTVAIAWLISARGIGNGVCLLVAVEIIASQMRVLFPQVDAFKAGIVPLKWLVLATFAAATWILLVVLLMSARWRVSAQTQGIAHWLPDGVTLQLIGVALVGISLSQSLVALAITLAHFVPEASVPRWLSASSGVGVASSVVFLALSVPAIYLFTAWAFDPSGIVRLSAVHFGVAAQPGEAFDERGYDRQLERITFLVAFGTSAAVLIFTLATAQERPWLSALPLAALAAVALDAMTQWRTHQRMAGAFHRNGAEVSCAECGASLGAEGEACAACGGVSRDDEPCREHPVRSSVARCVVCRAPLCPECNEIVDGRHVCAAHRGLPFVEGWAVVRVTETFLAAKVLKGRLAEAGLEAEVLSNTIAPMCAAPGLFDINPLIPLVPHRECGGGAIRVLVRPESWQRAMAMLEPGRPA